MALEKEGEEWKEYNSAVRWMVITITLSVIVTLFLAFVSMLIQMCVLLFR